ncbi:hypothetical protein QKW35_15745 [Pontibacterium granulatum]|nr:hypothetical protein [Pontibacterium granulatum]
MSSDGRPSLPPLEKLRRAALRQKRRVDELDALLKTEGDDADEIAQRKGPGARPKSRSERREYEQAKLDFVLKEIVEQEKLEGVEHVPLDNLSIPASASASPVGRPPKDELSILDRKLALAKRTLEQTMDEWDRLGVEKPEPISTTQKGKRRGRKPKPFPDRVKALLEEILSTKAQLSQLESELDGLGTLQRRRKLLRDEARELRKLKQTGEHQGDDVSLIQRDVESTEKDIQSLSHKIKAEEMRLLYGNEPSDEVEVIRYLPPISSGLKAHKELESLINRAQDRLCGVDIRIGDNIFVQVKSSAEAAESECKTVAEIDSVSEEDVLKLKDKIDIQQRYLELLKQKKAIQDEITRLEQELKEGN